MEANSGHASGTETNTLVAQPPADILETDTGFRIAVDMPGIDKDSIDLRLEGRTLEVRGSFRSLAPQDAIERPFSGIHFKRLFQLNDSVNKNAIDVRVEQGVLMVELPRIASSSTEDSPATGAN